MTMRTLYYSIALSFVILTNSCYSQIALRPISTTFLDGAFADGAAEISTYDPFSKKLFVVNGSLSRIDIFDFENPYAPNFTGSIDISSYGGAVNSIVSFDGYLAAAIEGFVKQDPGTVVIFSSEGSFVNQVSVGVLPDMIGIDHSHTKLATANEGEPSDDYTNDPEGSISIIDIAGGVGNLTQDQVVTIDFQLYEYIRQSFESMNNDWDFVASPMSYGLTGQYRWGVVSALGGRVAVHGTQFWGIQDLDNSQVSGATPHILSFESKDVTGRSRAQVLIRHFSQNFESGDYLQVKLKTYANQNWEDIPAISLNLNQSGWTTERYFLDDTDGTVEVQIIAYCDDVDDIAGIEDVHISFLDESTRVFGNNRLSSVKQDLEPEYVAFSEDDQRAFVTMQENNAIAIIDLTNNTILDIKGLGFKDHSLLQNAMDVSDNGSVINIATWPVKGMFQPDAISSFESNGETYYAIANEGDARAYGGFNEEFRVSSRNLDDLLFPNETTLKQNVNLGRLRITSALGDTDFDGDFDELYSYGARSFSILNSQGEMIYDSGKDFEQITSAQDPNHFNSNNDDNTSFDSRSDDKGPEPEGVVVGEIHGRNYAFVGLERVGGIMVYDVTDPFSPQFIQWVNNRGWEALEGTSEALDMGPEGIMFIPKDISPNERDLVVLSNEISGTMTVFEVTVDLTVSGEVGLQTFELDQSPLIGNASGFDVFEGGASGLTYLPNTDNEFLIISDRGPNADAINHPLAQGDTKVFVFPDYAPKIHHIRAENGLIEILDTDTLKKPNGNSVLGLPLPLNAGNTGELALDTQDNILSTDPWGLDSEGIVRGQDGYYYVCDEYGSSVWKIDENAQAIKRYTPFPLEEEDYSLDALVGKRRPNRGFEGIAAAPNGKIYAILQSPANNPDVTTGNNSRLHRIIEIDPLTDTWKTYLYSHKPSIGEIRERDWKIGDMVAVSNEEFLLIEHAERNEWNYKNIVKIDLSQATSIDSEDFSGLTPEQLINAETCLENGIVVAQGELLLDLLEAGWDRTLDKPEGLTIINDSTIAVINDNDFGIVSPNADGLIEATGKPTRLFIYTLPIDQRLDILPNDCSVVLEDASFCSNESVAWAAPEGYALYEWSNGFVGDTLSVDDAGIYTLRATDAGGCAAYSSAVLEIRGTPLLSLGEDINVCVNDTLSLIAVGEFSNISWSQGFETPEIEVLANDLNLGVNEIFAEVSNEQACSTRDTLIISVSSLPVVVLDEIYFQCQGEVLTLSTTNESDLHVWSTDEVSTSIEVSESGEYSVAVSNELGCVTLASTQVEFVPLPTPDLGANIEACEGTEVILSSGDWNTILWTDNSVEEELVVTASGTFGVSVTNTLGCEGSDEVEVFFLPLPEFELQEVVEFCQDSLATIEIDTDFDVLWSNGTVGNTLEADQEGVYTATVTDGFGCSSESEVFLDEVVCVGVSESNASLWKVYPNPVNDVLTIECPISAQIEVRDISGRVIHQVANASSDKIQLDTTNWSAGVYVLVCHQQDQHIHFLLEKW